LIFVHEFGHFITAKLSGVQVNEFAIFMGPAIFKKQVGETLYSIRLIPIGGYCAMEGEDEETDNPRAFCRAKWWKRLVILVAGAAMNFIIGVLLLFIVFSNYKSLDATVVLKAE
jgi:regulator of sigma E protease